MTERPAEPKGEDVVWYRGWEAGYDDTIARYTSSAWIAYKGGADLDAPSTTGKTWSDLLDAIDEEEDE